MTTPQNSTPAPTSNEVAIPNREMVDAVLTKIEAMTQAGLRIPNDYHPENSLRAAWLILQDTVDRNQKPVLQVCTKESIANAMLKMVLKGLNPHKNQCAFVAMGDKLTLMEEYQGKIAQAMRVGLKSIHAKCIYENDVFEFTNDAETGLTNIVKHESSLANMNGGKIIGAYAIIKMQDDTRNTEIMTIGQIQAAWNMGASKGQSPAHKGFPDQMCQKTVMTRALKVLINSSDDGDLAENDEQEYNAPASNVKAKVAIEIKENANKEKVSFEEATVVTEEPAATKIPEGTTKTPGF